MNDYIREINKKVSNAIKLVKEYREYNQNMDNLSVVFDIDGTLLSDDKPIKPVIYLYNLCKQLGYTIFIITARDSYGIAETINQLHKLGINDFHSVYFRIPSVWNIGKFKEASRKSIIDRGYQTILSIGDTSWDVGEFGGHSILLPQLGF